MSDTSKIILFILFWVFIILLAASNPGIVLMVIVPLWLFSVICGFVRRDWGHKFMGWHYVDKNAPRSFDGASMHCKCAGCGKDVMQDSQGNWF